MKKRTSKEKVLAGPQVDVAGLINKIEEHLVFLERKIDTLISRSSILPKERHFEQPRQNDRVGQGGGFRERNFYKVICADCKKECEVPFKPRPDRPVYCKECFAKRKNSGNLFKEKHDNIPVKIEESQEPEKKRKPAPRKAKKR